MTNEEKAAVLLKARKLLVKGWTKGVMARNILGRPVHPQCSSAVEFCAHGAIFKALNPRFVFNFSIYTGFSPELVKLLNDKIVANNITRGNVLVTSLMSLNDLSKDVTPVLRVFDEVIHDLLGDKP